MVAGAGAGAVVGRRRSVEDGAMYVREQSACARDVTLCVRDGAARVEQVQTARGHGRPAMHAPWSLWALDRTDYTHLHTSVYIHTPMYTQVCTLRTHKCVHYVHTSVYTQVCTHKCVHTSVYTQVCTWVCVIRSM
jgi:hypothetical protein